MISRGKEEDQRKFTPFMFDLNEKNQFIYLFIYYKSSSVSYTLKKNLKPITMLTRLVGNCGFFSNIDLKYRFSIPMQGLYSNSIMCLIVKPLVFPLVEWFLSYVVY